MIKFVEMKPQFKDILFVSIQFLLFFLFLFNIKSMNLKLSAFAQLSGSMIFVFGMIVCFFSILQLNRNLSPFPTPKRDGKLIQSGLYKYIRHPIYTGIILVTFGFSIYTASGFRLLISLLLLILFYFKSLYEEEKLIEFFDSYPEYKKKTGRFLPKLF